MAAERASNVSISEDGVELEIDGVDHSSLRECVRLLQSAQREASPSDVQKATFKRLILEALKEESKLKATIRGLRVELEALRTQNEDADEQIGHLSSRLKQERQKLVAASEKNEVEIFNLKTQLREQQEKFEELKTRSQAEIQQLKVDNLAIQRVYGASRHADGNAEALNLKRQLKEAYRLYCEITKPGDRDDERTAANKTALAEMSRQFDQSEANKKKSAQAGASHKTKTCNVQ